MKNSLNLSLRGVLTTVIFAVTFAASLSQAIGSSITLGKYHVGVISSPFSGAAVWKNEKGESECRYANSKEILDILAAVENKSLNEAVEYIESLKSTRELSSGEIKYCQELYLALYPEPLYKVAVNSRYPNNKTRPAYVLAEAKANGYRLKGVSKTKERAIVGSDKVINILKKINRRYVYCEVFTNEHAVTICEDINFVR